MKRVCVKCKHYDGKTMFEHVCKREVKGQHCQITGKNHIERDYCSVERSPKGLCKEQGIFFEPKWRYTFVGTVTFGALKGLLVGLAVVGIKTMLMP